MNQQAGVSRRTFVQAGSLTVGAAVGTTLLSGATPALADPIGPRASRAALLASDGSVYPDAWKVRPFPLSQVTVDESIFTRAQQQMLRFARAYPADRMLAVFRTNAGLPTNGAQPPGGWEGPGHPSEEAWGPDDYPGKDAPRANLLRGHFAGHFLSMLSNAYASTGEVAIKEKLDVMVNALGECQDALAATDRYSHPGFLAAYGEWQFSALEKYALYGEIWAPWYTAHKIMAGLLDAHRLGGSQRALEIVTAMGEWAYGRLRQCTPQQLERMWSLYIAGEYGGMNEVMMRLYALTGNENFLAGARLFDLNPLINACASGTDILNGKHANQHIPQFLGYEQLYSYTGEQRYLDAVKGFWGMVVPGRTYAHGGTGEGELWGPANTVAGDIGQRNAECCAAYNLLKVARVLFFHEPDAAYMDYYERTVTNHILGSRRNADSNTSPEVVYMFPVHPGALREYGNTGTCCGGTGMENHLKYQDAIYFHSAADDAIYVNLYISSTLDWSERGVRLVQRTAYPQEGTSEITVTGSGRFAVKLRVPGWATDEYALTVNGQDAGVDVVPGTYAELDREWADGDVIGVTIPLKLRTEATVDDRSIQALMHGPVVLFATSSQTGYQKLSLYGGMALDGSVGSAFESRGPNRFSIGALNYEPAYSGAQDRYHMYFQRTEPTVVFAGVDSGVRTPVRADETSLLDAIWAEAPFASKPSFVQTVSAVTQQFQNEGLINRTARQRILLTAGKAAF